MCLDELSVTVTEFIISAFANKLFPDDMKMAELCPPFVAPLYLTYLIMTYSILLKNAILLIMPITIHFQKFEVQMML